MRENKRGITLIALVVTIVVILILAAIGISMLAGDNGIINNAEDAKGKTEYAKIVEEVDLVWQDTQVEKIKNHLSNEEIADYFEKELQKEDEDATVKYVKEENIYEIEYKDNKFEKNATSDSNSNSGTDESFENLKIKTQPTNIELIEGNIGTFKVIATGSGILSYQWYSNSVNSTSGGNLITGATSSTYTIPETTISDNGKYYYCVITQTSNENTETVTSNIAKLTVVSKVKITTQPNNVTVTEGNTATFKVVASGEGTLTYQWYSNSTNSTSGGTIIRGATSSSYTISKTASSDNGKYYYVVISQTYGIPNSSTVTTTSTIAKLTINTTEISANPNSVTLYARGTSKTVIINGSNLGTLSISSQPNSVYATASLSGNTLTITPKAAGTTSITIKESNANKTVTINIKVIAEPTINISSTYSQNYVGNSTTFTVTSEGTYDSVQYQWYYNTSNIAGSGTTGATNNMYIFTTNTSGTYYLSCKATYTYNSETITVTSATKSIIIAETPTISISPKSGTIMLGNSMNFTATISGSKNSVQYQWYYNTSGTAGTGTIGGYSSTYNFTTSTTGIYYVSCKVICTYGGTKTITSTVAQVIVRESNYSITAGSTTTYYSTLAEAYAGATSGQTINLLRNLTDESTVTISKNIYLNLQTYTLTRTSTITISSGYTLYLQGTGKITNSYDNTITNNGTLNMSTSVTITSTVENSTYAAVYNTGTITMSNGTISGVYRGINNPSGTVNISGGIVTASDTSNGYAIYNYASSSIYKPKVTITGGNITGAKYGIYNYGTNSIVTIGSSASTLSTTNPSVIGERYGIFKSSGSWNFYNGILKGTYSGYYGEPTWVRDGYVVENGMEGNYVTAYLTEKKTLKAGDKVYYDTGVTSVGNNGIIECIVLYDEEYNEKNGTNYGIQVIASDVVDTVEIGTNSFSTSVNSYNNAIATLNENAEKYLNTTYAVDARCVGSVPDNKNTESGYFSSSYNYMTNYNDMLKDTDTNYETDYNQMEMLGIEISNDYYWLASYCVLSWSSDSRFFVRCLDTSGEWYYKILCNVSSGGGTYGYIGSFGLRPVFTLKSGIKIVSGDGKNIPYTLEP